MKGLKNLHPGHPSEPGKAAYDSYVAGFVMSIALTLSAYFTVTNGWVSGIKLVILITGLAILQLLVQLVFFLHLSREGKPRWNLTSFLFAALVVLIVVVGSLWIMYNLDYNMMPNEVEHYIMEEEGIHKQ